MEQAKKMWKIRENTTRKLSAFYTAKKKQKKT